MLAHQIFRRTNLDFFFLALFLVFRTTQWSPSDQSCSTENDSAPEKDSALKNALVLLSIFHVLVRRYLNRRIGPRFANERMGPEKTAHVEFIAA